MKITFDLDGLRENQIADSWTTVNRRIREEDVPAGYLVGRKRLWLVSEVMAWLQTRPTDKLLSQIKGAALEKMRERQEREREEQERERKKKRDNAATGAQ